GIGRQDLELREGGSQVRRVVDRRTDRAPVVLQETEDVERRRHDALLPAVLDDLALMRLRNRPAPRLLERGRVQRLHAEAHGAEAGVIQPIQERHVEAVETRLGLERQRESARLDLVAQLEAALALLAEQ